jgi:predicted ATPase
MGFNAMPGDQAGQRVFDVKLQDKLVLEGFDIAATAGAVNKAVIKEFKGIEGASVLVLELVPKLADPQPGQAPIINFIEIIKEEAKAVAGI